MLFFPVYMASDSRQLFSFPDPAVVFPSPSPHSRDPSKSFRMNTCKSASKQRTLTPFRMNTYEKQGGGAYFAQFWCNVSPFRINTCKSVSKQRTLTPFRMNTYEKRGGGGVWLTRNLPSRCHDVSVATPAPLVSSRPYPSPFLFSAASFRGMTMSAALPQAVRA